MCDVRKKLILANAVIEKYKKWQIDERKVKEEDALNGFSTTLLMKLLYLSCLYTMKDTTENTYRNTPFGVLDRWVALPNGPAEEDVYTIIGFQPMPTISYKFENVDGNKYSKINENYDGQHIEEVQRYYEVQSTDLDVLSAKYDLTDKKAQIEHGFDALINVFGNRINVSIEKSDDTIKYLSKITHLILWNSARNRNDKKLTTNNIYSLQDEYSRLKELEPKLVQVA